MTLNRVHRLPLLKPLSVRDFRLLWLGQGVSVFGDQFYLVALPWLALQLTGSGLALGTVLMVAAGSRAAFQLVGGAVSDRFTPRTLMFVSNVIRAAVAAGITIVVATGVVQLWHLYVFSILFGIVDSFFFPAAVSLVPMLIEKEYLTAGNALLRGTYRLMALLGPALAGLVISGRSLASAFAIDTATFVFAAVMVSLMRNQKTAASTGEDDIATAELSALKGLLSSITEGLRYAWRHPLIRELLFFIAVIEFSFTGPSSVGLASMAKQRFATEGATALGWMLSALGGGMLVGMIIAGSMKITRKRGRIVIGTSLIVGLGLAALGYAPNVIWAAIILALIGIGGGLANLTILALLQSESDRRVLGRVLGLMMFASSVLEPLSFALAGVMADINLTMVFIGGAAVMLLTCLISISFTRRALLAQD
jgi:MFS family permease